MINQNSLLAKGLEVSIPFTEGSMLPGAQLTSGSLVVGTEYVIGLFVAGDDFTNVGAFSNASGERFLATGTTPTTWTNDSILRVQNVTTVDYSDGSEITLNNCHSTSGQKGHGVKWYSFDGVDDDIETEILSTGANSYSIVSNVKPTSLAATVYMLDARDGAGDGIVFNIVSSGGAVRLVHNSIETLSTTTVSADTKYVLSASVTYGGTAKIYIDGVEVSYSTQPTINTSISTTTVATIGKASFSAAFSFMENSDLFIFNYAVSAANILSWSTDIAAGTFKMPFVDQGADNSEEISSWTNSDFASFTNSGVDISVMQSDGANQNCYSDGFTESGKTYRFSFTASGTLANLNFRVASGSGLTGDIDYNLAISSGVNSFTVTSATAANRCGFYATATGVDAVITNFSVVELGSTLTLDPSGIKDGTWIDYDHSTAYDASDPTFYRNSWSNSIWFNGSDSKMTLASSYVINTNRDAITFWAKRSATGSIHTVLGLSSMATESYLQFTASGTLTLETDTAADVATGTLVSDDTDWHMYQIFFNNKTVSMYQDGVALSMVDATVTDSELTIDQIGVSGTSTSYFAGAIGGFGIYNGDKILTTDQSFVDLAYDSSK